MRNHSFFKAWMRTFVSGFVFFASTFQFIGYQPAFAKGTTGQYSSLINDGTTFLNPNQGKVLDSEGTVWNQVDDIEKKKFTRMDALSYIGTVTESTGSVNVNQFYGWSVCIPTASVNGERAKVRLYNPKFNTQQVHVSIATGAVSGSLTFSSTNYFLKTLAPGDEYELAISSFIHPVVVATGTVSGEKIQVQEFRN